MEGFNDNREKLRNELEKQNKRLLVSSWVLMFVSLIFFLGITLLASYTLKQNEQALGLVMGTSFVLLIIVVFYAYKMEIDAGYYKCKNCNHKFVPSYKEAMLAPHTPTKKHLRCPECGKKTWAKKEMSKI